MLIGLEWMEVVMMLLAARRFTTASSCYLRKVEADRADFTREHVM